MIPKAPGTKPCVAEDLPSGSSNRSFGILFASAFGLLGVAALWEGRRSALWWLIAAFVSLLLALFAAPLLGPMNRAWRRLARLLSSIVNPIILGIVFYGVLTPMGILARLTGKDLLRLRFEKTAPTYWLPRSMSGDRQTSMTKQF